MFFQDSFSRFKAFLGNSCEKCRDFKHVIAFVSCIIMPLVARRSVNAAARAVRSAFRHPASLLRFLAGSDSPSVLLDVAQQRLLLDAHQRSKSLHLFIVDSTTQSHQGFCSENSISPRNTTRRPAASGRKQKTFHPKSCHCFVFALLLCPDGTRIPYWLPFYTQTYCKIRRIKHQTQADLAAQLIISIPLKKDIPVVVVGDTAFESKQVHKACLQRGYNWIAPVNPERVLVGADAKSRPRVRSLVTTLSIENSEKASFRLDQGDLAAMTRASDPREKSKKHEKVYWVHKRIANVQSVGNVVLLFSSKKEPNETQKEVEVQKVLMSNAVESKTEELLRWYALRWQIELFFKEMKSQLGMCQYQVRDFKRVEAWVNLCVLSFCYLEHYRGELLAGCGTQKQRAYWQAARVSALRVQLRLEVEKLDLLELLKQAKSSKDRQRLTALIEAGYDDSNHPRYHDKAS